MSPHTVESEHRIAGSPPNSVRSTRTGRRWTRVVPVGDVGVGGREPVRIQSMITASPMQTKLSAMQIEALARAGCEIVRVTVPSIRDAEALGPLRKELERSRLRVPRSLALFSEARVDHLVQEAMIEPPGPRIS